MSIMIIGLTGGIASGKSTVSKYLAEKGFKVYDADKIAKDISEKKLVQEEIIATFGDKILEENRNIDRKKLKEIVFEDKEKLKQLNAIIHPKVIDFYKKLKEKNTDEIIIFDVPLLFESGIEKFCDKILVVISDYEIQLNRIVERDKIDRELASKIIKSQLSNKERIKKADVVIENNSSLEDLFEKVERFCETI
ncbi:dephospho-CoA kinase [Fusobacterium polymorphum]|uniref:Dephospho-CoA kinase n=2 Tax=Fusobacterium nucleatum subsp. polymorphum TaxID=76857 RepID=A0A2C6C9G3_FUSNP|nr:dephospho-CoA kinase [Fusobacterium polymorphum]